MTDLPFEGRVALVAGASRGIGAATAEAFAAAGAAVVLGARDMAALESVVKRIEANGGRALAVRPTWLTWTRPANWPRRRSRRSGGWTRRSTTPAPGRCPPRWPTSIPASSTSASPPTSAAPSSA